ncbi:MAG: hypothetical protein OHK006_12900 [Thermodesulfovibrionales bacterium]
MKKDVYHCDKCSGRINGSGYSVSVDDLSPIGLDILCNIDPAWEKHYCGKQCLMNEINDMVDRLEQAGDAATSPACKPAPYAVRRACPAERSAA